MWRCGDTMRPFFALLKCNILPFVFPAYGPVNESEAPAAAGTGMNEWVHTHEHTQENQPDSQTLPCFKMGHKVFQLYYCDE